MRAVEFFFPIGHAFPRLLIFPCSLFLTISFPVVLLFTHHLAPARWAPTDGATLATRNDGRGGKAGQEGDMGGTERQKGRGYDF